jgi:ABC-type transport system substrate-binding protein
MTSTVDTDEITALNAEMEQILTDEMVFLPLYARLTIGAAWADEIGGYKHNPTQASHTWNVEEWYRADL